MSKYASTKEEKDALLILTTELKNETQALATLAAQSFPTPKEKEEALIRKRADIASIQRELAKVQGKSMPTVNTSQSVGESSRTQVKTSGPAAARVSPELAGTPFAPDNAADTNVRLLAEALLGVNKSAAAGQQSIDLANQAVQGDAKLSIAKAMRDQQMGQDQQNLLAIAGLGGAAPAFQKAIADLDASNAAYEVARKEFDAKASVDFFSNPWEFVNAQLELPMLAQTVNNLADQSRRAQTDFAARSSMTAAAQQVYKSNTVAADFAISEASAKLQLLSAQSKLAQVQSQQYGKEADDKRQLAAAAGGQISSDLVNMQRRMAVDALQEKKDEDAGLQAAVQWVNDNAGTSYTVDAVKRDPKLREKVLKSGTEKTIPLLDYVDMARSANAEGRLAPAVQPLYLKAAEISAAVDNKLRTNAAKYAGQKDAREQAYADTIKEAFAATEGRTPGGMLAPGWDMTPGPYKLHHPNIISAARKASAANLPFPIRGDNIVLRRLGYLADNGKTLATTGNIEGELEKQIIQGLIDEVARGDLKTTDGVQVPPAMMAKQIADYYRGARTWQNQQVPLARLGIPQATSYSARLDGVDKPTDLMNPMMVEMAIASRQSVFRMQQAVGKSLPGYATPAELIGNMLASQLTSGSTK